MSIELGGTPEGGISRYQLVKDIMELVFSFDNEELLMVYEMLSDWNCELEEEAYYGGRERPKRYPGSF